MRTVGAPRLQEATDAHGLLVFFFGRDPLAELRRRLPSESEFRARERRENAVARAVGIESRRDAVLCLRGHLVARDREDFSSVGLGVHTGAVEEERNIRLRLDETQENGVEQIRALFGVHLHICEQDLLDDTGLSVVVPLRAADPHTHLGRGVPPKDGAVLHQNHPTAVPRRGDSGTDPRETPADHQEVCGMVFNGNGIFGHGETLAFG